MEKKIIKNALTPYSSIGKEEEKVALKVVKKKFYQILLDHIKKILEEIHFMGEIT